MWERRELVCDEAEVTASLSGQIVELTDLFRRRLLDDREKQRAFDALYEELTRVRAMAEGELALPLARRVFHVIDRLDATPGDLAESLTEELVDALDAMGIEEVRDAGLFDPSVHELLAPATGQPLAAGQPIKKVRRGWRQGSRLVRAALVQAETSPSMRERSDPPPRGRT